jgi:hypothetical protein
MPLNNNLYGVYKSLLISGSQYVAESANRNRSMQVEAKNFIQGTPLSRILDIGGVSESITVKAPILVGGAAGKDGRALANTKIAEILSPATATLPILESANFQVSESGATVDLTLKSDGSTDSTLANYFQVTNLPINELNPLSAGGPTRVARFYDFRVSIGGRTFFIMEANLKVQSKTQETFFLIPKAAATDDGMPSDGQGELIQVPGTNKTYRFGAQFPFLGITGVEISGSGKAAVLLEDRGGDYYFSQYGSGIDESVNLSYGTNEPTAGDLTLQTPGAAVSENVPFTFEIYNASNNTWTNLLPSVNLSKSVVTKSAFNVTNQLLTVDFDFYCWIATS